MRAFAIDQIGDRGAIHEMPAPRIRPDQLLVRVFAAGVNPSDVRVRRGERLGRYPHYFPAILGHEVAGVVEEVGPLVGDWRVGDRAYGLLRSPEVGFGTFAELVGINPDSVLAPWPASLPATLAGAIPMAAMTALSIIDIVEPAPDQTIMVVGASGGVGSVLLQLFAQQDVRVVAVTRSVNATYVRSLGAPHVVDYAQGNVLTEVQQLCPEGVNAVVDLVNNRRELATLAELIVPSGHLLSAIYEAPDELARNDLRVTNLISTTDRTQMERVTQLYEEGSLVPPNLKVYPFAGTADALDQIESGHTRGKIAISMGET